MPVLAILLLAAAASVFVVRHTTLGPRIAAAFNDLMHGAEPPCCSPDIVLALHNMPLVALAVSDIWREGKARRLDYPQRLRSMAHANHIALMANGSVIAERWQRDGPILENLTTGINELKRGLSTEDRQRVDSIALFLAHSPRDVAAVDVDAEVIGRRHHGIRGYEARNDEQRIAVSPFDALRTNRRMTAMIADRARVAGLDPDVFAQDVRYRILDGEQILVKLNDRPRAFLMERGNDYVRVEDIDRRSVRRAAKYAIDWLVANTAQSGALAYGYRPTSRDVLPGNNLIRQWMATVALGRATGIDYDYDLWALTARNLDYNLEAYFHDEEGLGVVYRERGEVKLGAVALAALAVHENGRPEQLAAVEDALDQTIQTLWRDNGAFRSFLRPAGRTSGQNFYPGEALLYWAARYKRDRDPALLERFMTSFRYYRDWHRANRNPAFIGWHTQAYYDIWKLTGNDALRDFIFEMNDWLLNVQQWAVPNQYRDMMGRFYVPGGRFGPPHASSTGIYLEGLVDAFSLAREVGDDARAEAYRIAILRGLRSVLQLQFQDETDMFFVPEGFRKYVRGGVRTTVYDSTIRVDNVQHNLMAMMKVLRAFAPEDYTYPETTN